MFRSFTCFVLTAFLLNLNPVTAQQPEMEKAPVEKSWFKETFADAGGVFEGKKVEHLFKFKNNTDQPYRITHLKKTCGCASAWLVYKGKEISFEKVVQNPQDLPPGGEGSVKMLLDMTGIHGVKDGTATLRFTDSKKKHKHFTVKFQARGIAYFDVLPANIAFDKVAWNKSREFTFTITSKHVQDWTITDWKSNLPKDIKLADPEIKKDKDGITYTFKGVITGGKAGLAGGKLKLKTSFKNHIIPVDIRADVLPPYDLSTQHVGFGVVIRRRGASRIVTITNKDPEHQLRLEKVSVVKLNRPQRHLDIKIVETKPGQEIQIHLGIKRGAPKGFMNGKLRLDMSHPFAPKKIISFGAILR